MSRYREVDFAAALLACGPHEHSAGALDDFSKFAPQSFWAYRDRVYQHFFTMFPTIPIEDYNSTPAIEWTTFWREYITWINS